MAELTYKWAGDYLVPDLTIKANNKPIGKYGRMRMSYRYLKKCVLRGIVHSKDSGLCKN